MKIVHKNKMNLVADDDNDWKASARLLEQEGNNEKAIHLYESILKKHSRDAYIYDRLMILHRKEKAYKKELSLITTAIGKFTDLLQPGKNVHSKKVATLSKSILHSVGLTDKKGIALYQPQPIARWEKRKKTVKQKLTTGK